MAPMIANSRVNDPCLCGYSWRSDSVHRSFIFLVLSVPTILSSFVHSNSLSLIVTNRSL